MITVSECVEQFNFVAGVSFNLLLLFAIRRFTKPVLGSYKYLLTIFAAYDVFLSILHAALKPRVIIIDRTFGISSLSKSRLITSFHCASVTVPFALMIIHFLYRFWAIRYPHLISLFTQKRFIAFIASYRTLQFVVWYYFSYIGTGEGPAFRKQQLREEYNRRFKEERTDGWLILNYWGNGTFHLEPFFTLVGTDIIMIGSFTVASILGGMTFYHIKQAEKISVQANRLQWNLFITLCAQTFVPLCFVYIPCVCVLNFAFLGLPVLSVDDAFTVLTSCFPAWDAVIIILLMTDYRQGLINLFRKKKQIADLTTWNPVTTIVPSHITLSIAVPEVA